MPSLCIVYALLLDPTPRPASSSTDCNSDGAEAGPSFLTSMTYPAAQVAATTEVQRSQGLTPVTAVVLRSVVFLR